MTVPVLTTPRLSLRRHVADDLDAAAAMWGDPEIVRFIGGKPSTRFDTWNRLLRYIGHWSVRPFGYWAIVERESGRFIGDIGLADWHREGYGSLLDAPEAGWALARAAHGRGYALEALQAVLAWADREIAHATVCIISPENEASVRLAQKVGYQRVEADFEKADSLLLFRREPDSTAQAA
ncbi:GNAT family N-acetyltransferase [soil metagenome]